MTKRYEALLPGLAIALLLLLHLQLTLTRSINWDEFNYLRLVHEYSRGELTVALQTFHVRWFVWFLKLGILGVDQILVGRLFALGAEAITLASIVVIARRFASDSCALLCALAYLSVAYVMQHGWSFRADPFAISLCMIALSILTRTKLRVWAVFTIGVLTAIAFLITIKIVLLAPAFLGIAWLRWNEAGRSLASLGRLAALAITTIVALTLLYFWHSSGIAPPSEGQAMIDRSGRAMFSFHISRNWPYIILVALTGVPFFIALFASIWKLFSTNEHTRDERIALGGLIAPFFCVFFYKNIFPYFFPFILATVSAGLAVAMPALVRRYGQHKIALLFAAYATVIWLAEDESRLSEQRQIQVAVSQMFDEPVSYFDFPGFLPDHRKANFFMTSWGIESYHKKTVPGFTTILETEPVPLLLTIDPQENPTLLGLMEDGTNAHYFSVADQAALRSTYRQVWGPIYIAGAQVAAGGARTWHVRVPGPYTVEGNLVVNGTSYARGDIIDLDRGVIYLEAGEREDAGLLWGRALQVPSTPPPKRPYWTDF